MIHNAENDALVERIKAVLDAHQFNPAGPGLDATCHADDCGWSHPWDRPTHEMWDVHRAHVAGQVTCVIPPARGHQ